MSRPRLKNLSMMFELAFFGVWLLAAIYCFSREILLREGIDIEKQAWKKICAWKKNRK